MIGRTFGVYKILEKRGEGGMGVFYKALDQTLDRVVGLKTLHQELVADASFRQRLAREAKSLARLNHPNIVMIHQYLIAEGMHFIVMEYVEGQTLSEVIQAAAPVPFNHAARTFFQVLEAIGYAHQNNVVHRDVKPANIMVTNDGTVKVTDFGIAKLVDSLHQTRTGQLTGSPFYMAPEQVQGAKIDPRTDVYALGVTLFQMITGELPFTAASEYLLMKKHAEEDPPPASRFNRALTMVHDALIIRAMQKDPADRFQSTDEFANAVREVVSFETTTSRAPIVSTRSPDEDTTDTLPMPQVKSRLKRRKKKGVIWAFAAVLVVVLAAAYLAFRSPADREAETSSVSESVETQSQETVETPVEQEQVSSETEREPVSFVPPRLSMQTDFETDPQTTVTFVASVMLGGAGDSLVGLRYYPEDGITDRRLSPSEYEIAFVPFDGCPPVYEVWFIAQTLVGEDSLPARFAVSEVHREIRLTVSPASRVMVGNRIVTRRPVRSLDTTAAMEVSRLTLLNGSYPMYTLEMDPGVQQVQFDENLAQVFAGRRTAKLAVNVRGLESITPQPAEPVVLINGSHLSASTRLHELPAGVYLIKLRVASPISVRQIKFNGELKGLENTRYHLRSPEDGVKVNKLIFTVE